MGMSIIGKFFYSIDRYVYHNIKQFLKTHENSLEIIFLGIYVLLQLFLAFFVKGTVISIFIILFLFFLSLERICLRFKASISKQEWENAQKGITEELYKSQTNYNKAGEIIRSLEKENKLLKEYLRSNLKIK